MAAEIHLCKHIACKCNSEEDGFCNSFCSQVGEDTSEDDRKCGCGHMACDYTKQMGNEQTFDATGS